LFIFPAALSVGNKFLLPSISQQMMAIFYAKLPQTRSTIAATEALTLKNLNSSVPGKLCNQQKHSFELKSIPISIECLTYFAVTHFVPQWHQ